MIIQLQFSEIMGCANLFQRFLTLAVYCVATPSILLTHVHVTWLNIFISFINSNELSVLVLFSRSWDFIPGITFKDVLRFEERNKKVFFLNSEGNPRQYLKKNIGDIKT
jgi:hypothetical protein